MYCRGSSASGKVIPPLAAAPCLTRNGDAWRGVIGGSLGHRAYHCPARRYVGRGRIARGKCVVLATGENPAERIDPETIGYSAHFVGNRERFGFEVDPDVALPGNVAEVREQAVADVDHRRRAGLSC